MTPAEGGLVALQVLALAAIGLAMGDLLAWWGDLRNEDPEASHLIVGGPEQALLAIVGCIAFSVVLMVLHLVTGGAVFGSRGVVPALAIALVVWRRAAFRRRRSRPSPLIIVVLVLLAGVYVTPIVTGGPAARTGDSPWHLGWTEQLLHGERVPTGPAPEVGRNAYPWGFHALIATTVRLVPGTDPLLTHDTLHLVILAGVPLAAAAIARRFHPAAGLPAALATTLIGGFGWLVARGSGFETIPSQATRGADLVVASPNSVYELLPPAFPREIALVLFGALVVSLLACIDGGSGRRCAAAGLLAGLVGLVSVPMFITSLLLGAVTLAFVPSSGRGGYALRFFVPALALFSVWAAPVVVNHVRFGGFVDITPHLGVEWPLPTALGSWGLLLPLTVGGCAALAAKRDRGSRAGLAFMGVVSCFLAVAVARSHFDWSLGGNATLFHQGRVWPAAHLLAAAIAGAGIAAFMARQDGRRRAIVAAGGTVLLAVGAISPVIASVDLRRTMEAHEDGFIYGSKDFDPEAFIRRAAANLEPEDVVAAEGGSANDIAFLLFQLSGVGLAGYDDPRLVGNDLRIRFRELAAEWDARQTLGGFSPTHKVVPAPADLLTHQGTVEGSFGGSRWVLVGE